MSKYFNGSFTLTPGTGRMSGSTSTTVSQAGGILTVAAGGHSFSGDNASMTALADAINEVQGRVAAQAAPAVSPCPRIIGLSVSDDGESCDVEFDNGEVVVLHRSRHDFVSG